MNTKTLSLLTIMAAFLTGAFISVLHPTQVNWIWFAPVLAVGIVALFIYRKAHHVEARASHRLSGNLQILQTSLANILGNLETLNTDSVNLPVYEARFEIDRLLREDLNNFANARENMKAMIFVLRVFTVMTSAASSLSRTAFKALPIVERTKLLMIQMHKTITVKTMGRLE